MSRTAKEIATALHNARTMPVRAFGDIGPSQARADRDETIADLETQLTQRQAEESGTWHGQHPG